MHIARVWLCESHHMAQVSAFAHHPIFMPSIVSGWAFVPRCFFVLTLSPCVSPSPCSSLPTSTCTLSWTPSSMWTTPRQSYPASPPTEETCSLAEFSPPTSYEPKLLDDFHNSETTEMIFQEEPGDKDTEPSYLSDAELESAIFTTVQEREESADRRQAHHSHEKSLLPAQLFFAHSRTGRPCTNLVR